MLKITEIVDATPPCTAKIHHGPGHQSITSCDRRGPHKVHHAFYGRYDQEAFWVGDRVTTGYFDDLPRFDGDEYE